VDEDSRILKKVKWFPEKLFLRRIAPMANWIEFTAIFWQFWF
jgi:hypothetical protein